MKDWLSIGEFSKQTGFSNKALRLYEEKGLLAPHTRSESQYRYYSTTQIPTAQKIKHFKSLGFPLEQIKVLLKEVTEGTLKELLEKRLAESRTALSVISAQVTTLQSILASLNDGKVLTAHERSQVMESLLESSISHLKRRGLVNDENVLNHLSQEVSSLSPEMEKIIPDLQKLIQYAKEHNIFLGPGRGTSPASLILYGLDYTPFNPLQYGLIPELFGQSKSLFLDVEYSRHQEIGDLCEQINSKTSIEVAAFRIPSLDIFQEMQKKMGAVQFDSFSDTDPMILEAPRKGLRGLFGPEWNPNFDAFRSTSLQFQKDHDWDIKVLEQIYLETPIESAEDFINIEVLRDFDKKDAIPRYRNSICPPNLPELKNSRGLLIYREDWLKIMMRLTGVTVIQARATLKAIADKVFNQDRAVIDQIQDESIKTLLIEEGPRTFSKSHAVSWWWYYKRTAILKSLWSEQYLRVIDQWEQKHNCIWQEFGYQRPDGSMYLKAGS